MASKLLNEVKAVFEERKIRELKGYLKLCAMIKEHAEDGVLILHPDEYGEWFFSDQALIRLKEHDGFNIICDGAGSGRMSISLVGVKTVRIDWESV